MQFKSETLKREFHSSHPELVVLVYDVDEWLFDNGMERMTITDCWRTPEDQVRIWTPVFIRSGMSKAEAQAKARVKFSWHLHKSAVDWRHTDKPYSEEQVARIKAHLEELCPPEDFELLRHNIGLGLHFHIARREAFNPGAV